MNPVKRVVLLSSLVLGLTLGLAACNSGGGGMGGGSGGGSASFSASVASSASSSLPDAALGANFQLNQSSSYQLTSGDIEALQSEGVLSEGDQAALGQLTQ